MKWGFMIVNTMEGYSAPLAPAPYPKTSHNLLISIKTEGVAGVKCHPKAKLSMRYRTDVLFYLESIK